MHTFEWRGEAWNEDLPGSPRTSEDTKVTIHHNGGYDGNIKIVLPNRVGAVQTTHFTDEDGDQHMAEINVPFDAIKSLVLEYLRAQQIEALEQMDDEDLERFFVAIA